MAMCLMGDADGWGRVANAKPQLPKVRPLKLEVEQRGQAPGEAGALLALGRQPASGSTMSTCSVAFFFRRLLARPTGRRGGEGRHFRTRSLELVAGRSKLRPFYHTK